MLSGTPWWGTLLATMVAALAALGGTAIATWRQNRRAGREEWFRRLQWAEELCAASRPHRRAVGRAAMSALTESGLATPEDVTLINRIIDLSDLYAVGDALSADPVDAVEFVMETEIGSSEERS